MYAQEFPLDAAISYLNHAAVSPWPERTARVVREFAEENLHFGSRYYERWLHTEARLRESLRRLINAAHIDEIALLKSTSEGLSVVAHGLPWKAGDEVVISDQEFPSNRIVWESLQSRGVVVRKADLEQEGTPEASLLACCNERTRLLAISSVQYGTGLRMDLQTLGTACRQANILFCVDAIQSIGALPLDVQAIQADFVMADGHKWMLGPEGLALFYCRQALVDTLQLHQYGWHMVEDVGNFDRKDWEPAHSARRFECGSPNMLGIHALESSLSLLHEVGMEKVHQEIAYRVDHILQFIRERESQLDLCSHSDVDRRSGIVNFRSRMEDTDTLYARLQAAKVICAKRAGGIRFSPHFYTPQEALDRALAMVCQ